MAQAKTYHNKIQFWTEQLHFASNPSLAHLTRYTRERCAESLAYFTKKHREASFEPLEMPSLTDGQHETLANASVAIHNLLSQFAQEDSRWNEVWEDFDLTEAIEDYAKKLLLS